MGRDTSGEGRSGKSTLPVCSPHPDRIVRGNVLLGFVGASGELMGSRSPASGLFFDAPFV